MTRRRRPRGRAAARSAGRARSDRPARCRSRRSRRCRGPGRCRSTGEPGRSPCAARRPAAPAPNATTSRRSRLDRLSRPWLRGVPSLARMPGPPDPLRRSGQRAIQGLPTEPEEHPDGALGTWQGDSRRLPCAFHAGVGAGATTASSARRAASRLSGRRPTATRRAGSKLPPGLSGRRPTGAPRSREEAGRRARSGTSPAACSCRRSARPRGAPRPCSGPRARPTSVRR